MSHVFFGHSKLKPIGFFVYLKLEYNSDVLTSSIAYSTAVKTKNKAYTEYSTSVKNTPHEVSGKIAAVNEAQENEPSSDVMSVDQAYLSLKKDI